MKTLYLLLLSTLLIAGCGDASNSDATANGIENSDNAAMVSSAAGTKQGAENGAVDAAASAAVDVTALEKTLQGMGCFACHAVDAKRVGPSYLQIAERYRGQEGVVPGLVVKIINGGGGVWGPVPMVTHPQFDSATLTPLVEQILALE